MDSTDKKRFAYLTHYSRLGLIFCHMFAKSKNDDAVRVLRSLVDAKQQEIAELSGGDAEAEAAEKTTGGTVGIFEVLLMGTVPLKQFRLRRTSSSGSRTANHRKYQVEKSTNPTPVRPIVNHPCSVLRLIFSVAEA